MRFSVLVLSSAALAAAAAGTARAGHEADQFVGAAACANVVCHGSLVSHEGGNILHNEFVTWSERDSHARAFAVLGSPQSERIAAALGIGPASEAPACLDCHATNPAPELRGDKFRVEDGVSCESCHGAAGRWLASHDDEGRTHADNVAAGLTDLADVGLRARVCSSCHVGDDRRFVTHRILAAGHPRTSFELDTFTFLQPAHFRSDEDYARRKGAVASATVWAAGQAASLDVYLSKLEGHGGERGAAWPEFALFDCFSCHHPMDPAGAGSRAERAAGSLGLPAPLRASALMLGAAADVAGLPRDVRIDPSLLEIDASMAAGTADAAASAAELRRRASRSAALLRQWKPGRRELARLLEVLSSEAWISSYRSYADAEQATMAVQSVVASLREGEEGEDARRLAPALDGLFAATRDERTFTAAGFAAAMRRVAAAAR